MNYKIVNLQVKIKVVYQNEVIRTIPNQFFSFTKRFCAYKNVSKPTTLLEIFMHKKLLPLLFFVRSILFCWLVFIWFTFLYAQKNFCKRKANWFGVVLMSSFYYTTDMYPYQPACQEFIYTNLFLLVIICENLFLFIIICQNLFF